MTRPVHTWDEDLKMWSCPQCGWMSEDPCSCPCCHAIEQEDRMILVAKAVYEVQQLDPDLRRDHYGFPIGERHERRVVEFIMALADDMSLKEKTEAVLIEILTNSKFPHLAETYDTPASDEQIETWIKTVEKAVKDRT